MLIYGHRGARGEAPENTLAGFDHAYRHGIRHFELDLYLSADGIPVVIHDPTVDRTTDAQGAVASFTAARLARLDARRGTAPWPHPAGVPRLEDVFSVCPEFAHIQLEVKKDDKSRLNTLCNRLVELIQRYRWRERLTITSSDEGFLQTVGRLDGTVSTGLVTERRSPRMVDSAMELGCEYLCLKWTRCTPGIVEEAHKHGLHVSTWTVNRIHDMVELEKLGVDSIITDYPTSANTYFNGRP